MKNVPDPAEFAQAVTTLQDEYALVEENTISLNHGAWRSFKIISDKIDRIAAEIARAATAKYANTAVLAKLLPELRHTVGVELNGLIASVEKNQKQRRRAENAAGAVHTLAQIASATVDDRQDERWFWSSVPAGEKRDLIVVGSVQSAAKDVNARLNGIKLLLLSYELKIAEFQAEITAMEALPLSEELDAIGIIQAKMSEVREESKMASLDALFNGARAA